MRDCAKFLFNHNPFYPLSAALVMFGLREAMQAWGPATQGAWWLAFCLAGYTTVLAITAVLIIRAGQVWDDARTICLLVVLMFMATSASFDTLCVEHLRSAQLLLCGGWLFSILTTEGLIRSARLKFPLLYRGPFYLMLGLFFAFPATISAAPLNALPWDRAWQVMSFSGLAGLVMLSLIPAIRRGSAYVADNGSPWSWPLYPWSIFFIVTIGICGRAYLLTLSFQNDFGSQSSFGGYYLVPLAAAIVLLVLEVAIVQQYSWLRNAMLVAPWVLVVLASVPGTSAAYERLLSRVIDQVGSPLWLSLLAGLGLVLYMGWRGTPAYRAATVPFLLMLVVVGPQTRTLWDATPEHVWPMIPIAGYQMVMFMRRPTGWRFSVAWMLAVLAAVIYWRDTPLLQQRGVIPWHLVLLGLWLSCLAFDDQWSRYWRRRLPAVAWALAAAAAIIWLVNRQVDWRSWLLVYVGAAGFMAALSWSIMSMKLWKWSALGIGAILTAMLMSNSSWSWSTSLPPRAMHSLLLGAASFMIGGAISAAKAGLAAGSGGVFRREWQAVVGEWKGS